MSRYRDFPVLNNMNIQTHFQLEKHIVFHQMINHIDLKCERKIWTQKYERKNVSVKCGNHLMDSSY